MEKINFSSFQGLGFWKFLKLFPVVIFVAVGFFYFNFANIPASKAATTDATLFFNPASTSQIVGADFNLVARVNPGSNTVQGINAVQLDVTFDHAVLQLSSITASSPFTVMGSATINNTNGTASVTLFILASQITTTSDVATLAFHAQANGTNSPVAYASSADAAVNDGNGTLVVGTRTGATVTVTTPDTTPPGFTVNDGASGSYVQTDTINITVSDASGVVSQFYGFSTDSTCNGSDTINTAFTSGTNFNIAANHSDYLCVKATDNSSNSNVGYQLVGQLHTDNTAPSFTVNDGASSSSVKTDTINVTVADSASGVASRFYGFSTDSTCNGSDTINTAFASGTNFSIAGDHSDYLCLKSTDNATNASYQLVGQLHTDNTAPTVAQVSGVAAAGKDSTPDYIFSASESGSIVYGGDCSSSTNSASSGSNAITFSTLAYGYHSNCTIRVTDTAGNQSSILGVNSFLINYPGDINSVPNHSVNLSDLSILAADYGRTSWCGHNSDINGDCSVNLSDLSILAASYGQSF